MKSSFARVAAIAALASLLLTSCSLGNPAPSVDDVTGSWTTEGSALTLEGDGTFTATDVPISIFGDKDGQLQSTVSGSNSIDRTTSGGGYWAVTDARQGPYPIVALTFDPNPDLTAPTSVNLLTSGSGSSRDVFFALGRRDGGVLTFTR